MVAILETVALVVEEGKRVFVNDDVLTITIFKHEFDEL